MKYTHAHTQIYVVKLHSTVTFASVKNRFENLSYCLPRLWKCLFQMHWLQSSCNHHVLIPRHQGGSSPNCHSIPSTQALFQYWDHTRSPVPNNIFTEQQLHGLPFKSSYPSLYPQGWLYHQPLFLPCFAWHPPCLGNWTSPSQTIPGQGPILLLWMGSHDKCPTTAAVHLVLLGFW